MNTTSNREIDDKNLFNTIAQTYSKKDTTKSTAIVRKFELLSCLGSAVKDTKNSLGVVVEIGCGIGAPAYYLNGMYEKYIGIDYSEEFIEIAEKLHADKDNVSFICSNIKDSGLNGVADIVLAVGVLHHIDNLDFAMESILSILKSGGIFVAIEPQNANPIVRFIRKMRQKIDSSYSAEQVFFEKKQLLGLFQKHKLEKINFEYKGFVSPPFGEIVLRPEFFFIYFNSLLVLTDRFLNKILPDSFKFLSWGCVVSGKKV